jgi:hypothetical protein
MDRKNFVIYNRQTFVMHNIFLALSILLMTAITGNGQCNRKVNWHAAKAELLDENGVVVDTDNESVLMVTDKSTISFSSKTQPNQSLEGVIKETNCNWKDAFKNGKTIYKAELRKSNSDKISNGTIVIEAKEGRATITMEMEEMPGKKVRLSIDKYEEADNDLPIPRSIIDLNHI